jgi:PEGA domain-containing protein
MRNRAAGALILLLPFTGCSLILKGTTQQVAFTSEPSEAVFTIDGQKVRTPVTLSLSASDRRLVFSKEGCHEAVYELKTKTCPYFYFSLPLGMATIVDLVTGAWREFETESVHVQLRPMPGTSVEREVRVTSDPPGAAITIGGLSYGTTPAKFRLTWAASESAKEVELKLAGYADLKIPLRWESPVADVRLAEKPESVVTKFESDPPGAEVWVDGVLAGPTPRSEKYDWSAAKTSRKVEFRMEGYAAEMKTLTKAVPRLAVGLTEVVEKVTVKVESDPPGAALEVDGASAGQTPSEVGLDWSVKSKRRHAIRIIRAGYWPEEVLVDGVRKREPVTIRLRPLLPRFP